MKATIEDLWETGRQILAFDGPEFGRPKSIADLKKCNNVVVGDKIPELKMQEVMIDNRIFFIQSTTVRHPMGGTMYILEVIM